MPDEAIARVDRLQAASRDLPQVEIRTHHLLHAGVYARTIMIPAGTLLTGVLVDIPTTLIVSGDCTVAFGDGRSERLIGYQVLAADRHRKQAFLAHADTHMTTLFATTARSVRQAEEEFTAETEKLMSRRPGHANTMAVTGL